MQSHIESVETFRKKREEAVNYIQSQTDLRPAYLLILGTGLGRLAEQIDVQDEIPYGDIPHFPVSTVESHQGRLIFGKLKGKTVVAMQGRFHYYEGYTMQEIVFPIRVLHMNGARMLLVSNACGGLNPNYSRGDIMLINDHINLLGDNPLTGPNDDELGTRFPDMSQPYTKRLLDIAEEVALEESIRMHHGVYTAVTGPNLETKAEYRFLRTIGSDVIGMSTIPEVISAVHMEMEVLGISVITDECFPEALEPVSIEDVLAAANMAEPKMTSVFTGVLERL